jgi:hypothetical protein
VNSQWDIAVLLTADPGVAAIPLAADAPHQNEPLTFGGFGPHGQFACGVGRLLGYVRMQGTPTADTLRLSGAARQGDSGGPIVNVRGEIVGLIVGTDGRIVIGPSCRPIARFVARFRSLLRHAIAARTPQRPVGPAPPPGNSVENNRPPKPEPPAASPQIANDSTPPHLALPDPHTSPEKSSPVRAQPATTASGNPQSKIRNLKSEILTLALPILFAALGISVPPTTVLVALRVIRFLRGSRAGQVRGRPWLPCRWMVRRRRNSRAVRSEEQPPNANDKADKDGRAGCRKRAVTLERHLNDDYARELAGVFAYDGRSPLQDATLGREFSREIDRAAESSDARMAEWATGLRDRVLRRFHRIHGWTPAPAEPAE